MAGAAWSTPSVFWPLGLIKVPTPGTPVALNNNVGAGTIGPLGASRRVRQLIISALATNTKPVYLVLPGYSHTATNGVILIVTPGVVSAIPAGCLLDGAHVTIDSYSLDAEVANEGAYVTAIYG